MTLTSLSISRNPLQKSHAFLALLFLLAVSFLVSWPTSPLRNAPGSDREIYRYVGMVINNGGLPYRDVFDHKPPMFYFLAALGHRAGPWGLWGLLALLTGVAAWLFYLSLRKRGTPAPLVFPVLFLMAFAYSPLVEGGGQIRQLVGVLIMALYAWHALWPRAFGFGAGLMGCLIFFSLQNELFSVVPLIWYGLTRKKVTFKTFLWPALGALAVLLPLGFYLLSNGLMRDFWDQAFGFNMHYYIQKRPLPLRLLIGLFGMGEYYLLGPALLAAAFLFRGKSHDTALRNAAALGVAVQFLACSLSGNRFGHYFLPFIPHLVWLLVLSYEKAVQWIPVEKRHLPNRVLLAGLGFFLLPTDPVPYTAASLVAPRMGPHPNAPVYNDTFPHPELRELLDQERGRPGHLYVFRDRQHLSLNTDYGILAPTKWIYTFFWDAHNIGDRWDPDGKIFAGILSDVQSHKTKYILDFSPSDPLSRASLQYQWDVMVQRDYESLFSNSTYRFLRRRAS